ncbi:hypothetical protein BKA66DRAFT_436515 [Pyrenochaeta sp. MPI-SDFR-AT-0127]|nr:hypothetical protein BKA66DRAFT_436515 [Pyrenochaeta sp. MPI-SDFR-AT-0127]
MRAGSLARLDRRRSGRQARLQRGHWTARLQHTALRIQRCQWQAKVPDAEGSKGCKNRVWVLAGLSAAAASPSSPETMTENRRTKAIICSSVSRNPNDCTWKPDTGTPDRERNEAVLPHRQPTGARALNSAMPETLVRAALEVEPSLLVGSMAARLGFYRRRQNSSCAGTTACTLLAGPSMAIPKPACILRHSPNDRRDAWYKEIQNN